MKPFQLGPVALEISVASGVVSLKASVGESLGGGEASGVAKASLSGEIDLSAAQAADLGLGLLAAQFPSLSAEIALAKGAIDSELAKISV